MYDVVYEVIFGYIARESTRFDAVSGGTSSWLGITSRLKFSPRGLLGCRNGASESRRIRF